MADEQAEVIERPVRVKVDDDRGLHVELHQRAKALRLVDDRIDTAEVPDLPAMAVARAAGRKAKAGAPAPRPMANRILTYDLLTVYDITLQPGATFTFKRDAAKDCIGSIYVRGVIRPIGETIWPDIVEHREWRERGVWGDWKDDGAEGAEATFEAGPEGARWLCLAGRIGVYQRAINGKFAVPAGFGAVIGWVGPDNDGAGVVDIEGAQASTGHFLEPCKRDVTIVGTADLLLVR